MNSRHNLPAPHPHTHTSIRVVWSAVMWEKWFSSIVMVLVSATCPQPQNRATPEKHRMVATSEAYGTPPRHLMQQSKQPAVRQKDEKVIMLQH